MLAGNITTAGWIQRVPLWNLMWLQGPQGMWRPSDAVAGALHAGSDRVEDDVAVAAHAADAADAGADADAATTTTTTTTTEAAARDASSPALASTAAAAADAEQTVGGEKSENGRDGDGHAAAAAAAAQAGQPVPEHVLVRRRRCTADTVLMECPAVLCELALELGWSKIDKIWITLCAIASSKHLGARWVSNPWDEEEKPYTLEDKAWEGLEVEIAGNAVLAAAVLDAQSFAERAVKRWDAIFKKAAITSAAAAHARRDARAREQRRLAGMPSVGTVVAGGAH